MRLDAQLAFAEQRVRELTSDLQRVSKESEFWKSESDKFKIQVDVEQESEKKARQQLRVLAEKLHQAGAQLQKLEQWRSGVMAEQKDSGSKILELSQQCETLGQTVEQTIKSKEKVEGDLYLLNEKVEKQRQIIITLKQKCAKLEAVKTKLQKQFQAKDESSDQLNQKYMQLVVKNENEMLARQNERRVVVELEGKVASLNDELAKVRASLSAMVMAKQKLEQSLNQKELEVTKLKGATVEKGIEALPKNLSGLPVAWDNQKPDKAALKETSSKLRSLLRSRQFSHLQQPLLKLRVEDSTLAEWLVSPAALLTGLDEFIHRFNTQSSSARQGSDSYKGNGSFKGSSSLRSLSSSRSSRSSSRDMRSSRAESRSDTANVNYQVKDLKQKLQQCQAHRSRAVRQLLLSLESAYVPSDPSTRLYLSSADGPDAKAQDTPPEEYIYEEDGASTPPPPARAVVKTPKDSVQLPGIGLEDIDVKLLQGLLRGHSTITSMDLSDNHIRDEGLLEIAKICLHPTSNVRVLDMQQNFITLEGMETLAVMAVYCSPNRATLADSTDIFLDKKWSIDESDQSEALCTVLSADLQRHHNQVIPVIEIKLSNRTIVADLRYNSLQQSDDSPRSRQMSINRIIHMLSLCSASDPTSAYSACPPRPTPKKPATGSNKSSRTPSSATRNPRLKPLHSASSSSLNRSTTSSRLSSDSTRASRASTRTSSSQQAKSAGSRTSSRQTSEKGRSSSSTRAAASSGRLSSTSRPQAGSAYMATNRSVSNSRGKRSESSSRK